MRPDRDPGTTPGWLPWLQGLSLLGLCILAFLLS